MNNGDRLGFRTPIEIREARQAQVTNPEAKLLRMPAGDATLRAQLRRFERERGCRAVGVRASGIDFEEATRLVEPLALAIEEDETVRAGHLVLVGDNNHGGLQK